MARCEDYPCCGHTEQDPCEPQWYDAPGAFDTSRPGNEHALCDHGSGECDVPDPDEDEDEDLDDDEPNVVIAVATAYVRGELNQDPESRAHAHHLRENSESWLSHYE